MGGEVATFHHSYLLTLRYIRLFEIVASTGVSAQPRHHYPATMLCVSPPPATRRPPPPLLGCLTKIKKTSFTSFPI